MGDIHIGEVVCTRLDAGAWRRFRAIRLAMLADTPGAFMERVQTAALLPGAVWRERTRELAAGGCFVADLDGRDVGFVATTPGGLVRSMYVAPDVRGAPLRIARRLLDLGHAWAIEDAGCDGTRLWVRADNGRALGCYRRAGYRPGGATRPYGLDRRFTELELFRGPL